MITRILFLTLIFASLQGAYTVPNIVGGALISTAIVWCFRDPHVPSKQVPVIRFYKLVKFMLYYFWEVMISNFRVAKDVLKPKLDVRPAIVAVPLDAKTDTEIAWLAHLISFPPGTVSMDISDDRSCLYIHVLSLPKGGQRQVVREIKDGIERRLLEVLR